MSSSSFPVLDVDCSTKDNIVLGHGTLDGRKVFVKLAERGFADRTLDREAEIHVNRRVADMIEKEKEEKEEKNSFISNCFLAAECHEREFEPGDFNKSKAPCFVWLRKLIAVNEANYPDAWLRKWDVVFFVMRPLGDISLAMWWDANRITDDHRAKVFAQLVLALEMLAKHGITHNDLHWNNVRVEPVKGAFPVGGDWFVCNFRPVIYDWDRAVLDVDKLPKSNMWRILKKSIVPSLNDRFLSLDSTPHVAEHHPYVDLIALYKSAVTSRMKPRWLVKVCEILEKKIFKNHPGLRNITHHQQISCLPSSKTTESPQSSLKCEEFVKNPPRPKIDLKHCHRVWSGHGVEVPSPVFLASVYASLVKTVMESLDRDERIESQSSPARKQQHTSPPESDEIVEINERVTSVTSRLDEAVARVEAARVEAARVEAERVEAERVEAEEEDLQQIAEAIASLRTKIDESEQIKIQALADLVQLSRDAREIDARANRLVDIFASFYIRY